MRLLTPALGGFALLEGLGSRTPRWGSRASMAYMVITTTAFLCTAVGAPAAYPRQLRLGAAVVAAGSPQLWAMMIGRVRRRVDAAIREVLDDSPALLTDHTPGDALAQRLAPLIVDTTFDLVQGLPEETLTGELPVQQVRQMMFADHLAFGAVEWLRPRDTAGLAALATQFQLAAIDNIGARP